MLLSIEQKFDLSQNPLASWPIHCSSLCVPFLTDRIFLLLPPQSGQNPLRLQDCMLLLWVQMEGLRVRTYTLATGYTGNCTVTQYYRHTLFEQHLSRNKVSIKGKRHWKSRHIRICLAPNFCEFIRTELKKVFHYKLPTMKKKGFKNVK